MPKNKKVNIIDNPAAAFISQIPEDVPAKKQEGATDLERENRELKKQLERLKAAKREPRKERITLYVTKSTKAELAKKAKKEKRSINDYINAIIEEKLQQRERSMQ